jgi:hypothetical protein
MRAGGRFCVLALCAAGLLMLLPALVDKPAAKQDPPAPLKAPPAAVFLKLSGPADVQPVGGQSAPQRLARPRWAAVSLRREPKLIQTRADQNGNPLCGGSYIHSVYRAFRLWERSG